MDVVGPRGIDYHGLPSQNYNGTGGGWFTLNTRNPNYSFRPKIDEKKKRSHASILLHTQSSSSVYDFRCYGFHASAIFRPFSPEMIDIYEKHVIILVHSLTRSWIVYPRIVIW